MKKYAIISNKKRNQLIERVVLNGESVSRVSKQLRMKLPSAKSIIRTYKKTGKIFDKKKIINRKSNCKKTDLSETDNQSYIRSESQQKVEEKIVKEEIFKKGQSKLQQQKQQSPAMVSSFQICPNMEQIARQFYSQMYLTQEIVNYYNWLTYNPNPWTVNTQF